MGTPPDFELNRNGTGTPSNRRYRCAWEEYSLTSSYVNRILLKPGTKDCSCSDVQPLRSVQTVLG
jgi:hypothetical protein